MLDTTRKVISLFSPSEQRELYHLFAVIVLMALLEVAGVASIMPFLQVVANPESIETNALLSTLYNAGGFETTNAFLFALGVAVFLMILLTNVVGFGSVYLIQQFTWMRNHTLSTRLLETYIHQPWSFFLERNTGELSGNILTEVQTFITTFLIPFMLLIANAIAAAAVAIFIFITDPVLAVLVGLAVCGAYALVYKLSKTTLKRRGSMRKEANASRYRMANEALSAIKTVKVTGMEGAWTERYSAQSKKFSTAQAIAAVLSYSPRYALEVIAFGAIVVILLYQIALQVDVGQVIPVVGLYAFAGYRLLPKMQQIYYAASRMQYTSYTLNLVFEDVVRRAAFMESSSDEDRLTAEASFGLQDVTFHYPNTARPALDAVSITIPVRSSIGIIGSTGSGKTTCMDVLLALMEPTSGAIVIDGEPLQGDDRFRWRKGLGYVPQQIFLSDDTIAANIAFGVPEDDRDLEAIEAAARIANLHAFIDAELPEGYDTVVGERGVRLSGGQRQRIGIARALYNDPDVIFFDEATSALDNVTEQAIMEAIESLAGHKTLIMIAHRLTTVQKCDQIFRLEQGKLVSQGTWDELMASDESFRQMAHPDGGFEALPPRVL